MSPRGRLLAVWLIDAAFILASRLLAVASIESRFSAGIGAAVAMVGVGRLKLLQIVSAGLIQLLSGFVTDSWDSFTFAFVTCSFVPFLVIKCN